jgi:hypothetical protein
VQLAKRSGAVPLTRDYIMNWERADMPATRRPMRAAE